MVELSETQIRYLETIQAVINRMASNAFALKALAGTLAAGQPGRRRYLRGWFNRAYS